MEQWEPTENNWLVRQVRQAEANDPALRPMKDAVSVANERANEASAQSADGLVPQHLMQELGAAIWKLNRYAGARRK